MAGRIPGSASHPVHDRGRSADGLQRIERLHRDLDRALIIADASSTQLFNVQDNGFIGIGTTTPFGTFSVSGASFGTNNGVCFEAKGTGSTTSYTYWYFTARGRRPSSLIDDIHTDAKS